ncbi:MAG: peptide chain release factor 1 [Waddliaceae bacterium]|jgi:peptide chain release factor 1|nr:peptide chain release factor 1 [Waddliaceae bacterium]MBT3579181.1 peptide chain release factor 1 [Waddliaceae bacterium]MBT4444759.1 peptide chain release factor 1 [Waddliaceae bacterium]MBT6928881.1 peptide chain release factor 1 [Waddliaceae bacterium]MBT7264129.1 peptide chain release factor 1 [Waddliaceae bacterium]
MKEKIQRLLGRCAEVEEILGDPEVFSDNKRYKALTQEHSYLSDIKDLWEQIESETKGLADNKELAKSEEDEEFLDIINEDITTLESSLGILNHKLETLLVPPDPHDNNNTILEFRAGTGGDEAAIFVGDCVRMYMLYADKQKWKYEQLSCSPSEAGGYKEYVMVFSGKGVHRKLQYEGGTHRVQRVPETETQGRVHTSAITVAIMLEPDEEDDIVIDEKDLRIDTMRASGAGGQHVNTTDSAVRITHIPTGIVSGCKEEKSQHKNKDKAMRLLKAKLLDAEREKQHKERSNARSQQIGSGDRSERIRTYNFSQNRITDHRINLTKYNLENVMNGDLDDFVDALVSHFHQKRLQSEE